MNKPTKCKVGYAGLFAYEGSQKSEVLQKLSEGNTSRIQKNAMAKKNPENQNGKKKRNNPENPNGKRVRQGSLPHSL